MAEDAVDAAVAAHRLSAGPSPTATVPLVGAAPPRVLAALRAPQRMISRYGTEAEAVHALATREPDLAGSVLPGHPTTRAELLWAVLHEGRWTPPTCWTGVPASGWSPPTVPSR